MIIIHKTHIERFTMGKKFLAILLCLMTILPLAAFSASAAESNEPILPAMDVADLGSLSVYDEVFPGLTEEESREIWEWAREVVTAWYGRYAAILKEMETEQVTEGFVKDDAEYSVKIDRTRKWVNFSKGTGISSMSSRVLSTLKNWATNSLSQTTYERTIYGGFMDEANKQEATGFFYVKKIDGRWFYIDPLGYPTIIAGVQGVTPSFSGNTTQKEWVANTFGSDEKWAVYTSLRLKKTHGVYASSGHQKAGDLLYDVPEGLVNISCAGPGITRYCIDVLDIGWDAGSTYFDPNISEYRKQGSAGKSLCNMVMPVFDQGFVEYMDEAGKTMLAPYANENRIVAWSCANEIPIKTDMLNRYLKYTDPAYMQENYPNNPKTALYYETYAVTMTWTRFMTGDEEIYKGSGIECKYTKSGKEIWPTGYTSPYSDELNLLFLGFIYDHLLSVCSKAYKTYVPNHLFLGVRWLSNGEVINSESEKNTILHREWVARFASRYCDLIAINWYNNYYAPSENYQEFSTWTQNKPILITEFSSWTMDDTEYDLSHIDRSNCLRTQADRGLFFEHMALDWMEWDTIIGWSWYRYNHYTVNNKTQSSATGILTDDGRYYTAVEESMGKINNMAYNIARFLHDRH